MSEPSHTATFEDSKPLVLSEDPIRKIRRLFHYDPVTRQAQVQTQQLEDPVLEANQESRKDAPTNWKGNMHRVARIPIAVWHALPDHIKNDEKALRKWLDQSDQRPFRTRGGHIS